MAADSIPSWTRPSTPSSGCQVSSAFSCRIVDIGSYLVSPHSDLDVIYSNYSGERIKSVPIIRIFGATPGGQKACVHVHGAFPYLYIPYGIDNPTYNYLQILHQSIDHALQIINNKHDDTSYVFKILPVRGIPFYGYHGDKQVFLKILLYAPENVKKLSDLLLSGAIMNETYQPHESHIPFPLQFMIDYNLYGMNFIHASSVKFRIKDLITDGGAHSINDEEDQPFSMPQSPISSTHSSNHSIIIPSQRVWDPWSLPKSMVQYDLCKQSSCALEVDVKVEDIINREEFKMTANGGYPGLTALWEEEQARRDSLGLDDCLHLPPTPDRVCTLVHEMEQRHLASLHDIIDQLPHSPSPPPLVSSDISQSCDIRISDWPSEARDVTPPIQVSPYVNETKVDHSIRLTKKLSSISLQSSDAELVDLLVDLAHSQDYTPSAAKQSKLSNGSVDRDSSDAVDMTTSQRAPPMSGCHDDASRGVAALVSGPEDEVEFDDGLSQIPLSQLLLTQMSGDGSSQVSLSSQERAKLVQLCTGEGEGDDVIDYDLLEDDEMETLLMSQPLEPLSEETEFIPQLDGNYSNKKRKSLGLSRRKRTTFKQTSAEGTSAEGTLIGTSKGTSVGTSKGTSAGASVGTSKGTSVGTSAGASVGASTGTSVGTSKGTSVGTSKGTSVGTSAETSIEYCAVTSNIVVPESHVVPVRYTPSLSPELITTSESAPFRPSLSLTRKRQSKETTPIITTPTYSPSSDSGTPTNSLTDKALNNSLYPKVKKLSREESLKYEITSMREIAQSMGNKRKSEVPVDVEAKRRCTRSSSHSMEREEVTREDEEEQMIKIAIEESLKSLKDEQEMRHKEEIHLIPEIVDDWDSPIKATATTPNVDLASDQENSSITGGFNLVMSASESEGEDGIEVAPIEPDKNSCSIKWNIDKEDHGPVLVQSKCILRPMFPPPRPGDLSACPVKHPKPFYSNPHDVQPPQNIGGTSLHVPSSMVYELSGFNPPLLDNYESNGRFTLEHWRTVMSVMTMDQTQVSLPPPCHPERPNMSYSIQDYQRDVKTRSKYWPKGSCIITPAMPPPSRSSVLTKSFTSKDALINDVSGMENPNSCEDSFGFQFASDNSIKDPAENLEVQFITVMSVELHVRTRGGLRPDPEWDPVLIVFYYVHNDWSSDGNTLGIIAIDLSLNIPSTPTKKPNASPSKKFQSSPAKILLGKQSKKRLTDDDIENILTLIGSDDNDRPYLDHCGVSDDIHITYVADEKELFDELIKLVRGCDPDILLGYEVQMLSWGYLKARASYLGINLIGQLSRVPNMKTRVAPSGGHHMTSSSDFNVTGRIMLSVWRSMKDEVALTSYAFENVLFHVLKRRVPHFYYSILTDWYDYHDRLYRNRVVEYYVLRCYGNYQLLEKFNIIGRMSELARLYGIEFQSVLSRGSQYRVESMMLRLAKQSNFITASPSVQQRSRMAAPECLPLIMEPESKFYSDPILVLDFQSLYPSIIIAYNYCFSTCLGRVKNLINNDGFTFGTCSLRISGNDLKKLENDVTISPNGVVFVKPVVRRGILPRMLEEILDTRVMVKQSMKIHKKNKVLQRLLDARQLGLKLIANVTYGYTAANYSGRMPCVEIADSIVRKARETLERAIQLVNSTSKWRARVVYGDTDSLFVLLKGVSKEVAFKIGNEICQAVTADNPKPVKLKFEKVYLPCILQTKKRYCGYMYETIDQEEPVFEAKGIETVRRDGCPAVSKILEKSLHLLFSTCDMSLVKRYVQRQCSKILEERVSIKDFIIAKEYRGRGGYRPKACVPALELAKQATTKDRRAEPLVNERVPYVVVYGTPGLPLIQLIRKPEVLLSNPSLRLNGLYYITKQILPALDRSFIILGVDVYKWFNELSRPQRSYTHLHNDTPKGSIAQYFTTMHCQLCDALSGKEICSQCSKEPHRVVISLSSRIQKIQRYHEGLCQLCQFCCLGGNSEYYLECASLDCPVFYSRQTSLTKLKISQNYQKTLDNFLTMHNNQQM